MICKSSILFCVIMIFLGCNGSVNQTGLKEMRSKKESIMKKKPFKIKGADGNFYEVFPISKEQFDSLTNSQSEGFVKEIYEQYNLVTYQLSDSRIVVAQSGNYAIYPDKALLLYTISKIGMSTSKELLSDKNPYGDRFPEHVNSLVLDFKHRFGISDNLDGKALIMEVDKVIRKNRNQDFFDNYFLCLIAVVGEYFVTHEKAIWVMELASDNTTWQPYLKLPNRNLYFIHYVLKDFYDSSIDFPLSNTCDGMLDILRADIKVTK